MSVPEKLDVLRFDNSYDFYRSALDVILEKIKFSLSKSGKCSIALSGGKTPEGLLDLLSRDKSLSWEFINLFWVDERCVPPDSPDSNFGMVQRTLLSKISIPETNVHSVVTEGYSVEESADVYELQLKKYFDGELPGFDLVLLGMGADGHVASLFPGETSLGEKRRWTVAVDGKQRNPPVPRVTLTFPVINNARGVVFLVSGDDKKDIVDEILSDHDAAQKKYPAAMVHPRGELIWIIL